MPYIPLSLDLSSNRLKQLTAIGAGVLIGSAFLVIIPEALELLEAHEEDEDQITGSVALVILEFENGDIRGNEVIEEIEELVGGHDAHEGDGHEGDDTRVTMNLRRTLFRSQFSM